MGLLQLLLLLLFFFLPATLAACKSSGSPSVLPSDQSLVVGPCPMTFPTSRVKVLHQLNSVEFNSIQFDPVPVAGSIRFCLFCFSSRCLLRFVVRVPVTNLE